MLNILHVRLRNILIIHYILAIFSGVPELSQMQWYVRSNKPSYKAKQAGLQLLGMVDLIAYSQSLAIPPTLALLNAAPSSSLVASVLGGESTSLYIPMQAAAYGIHGACYTGKTQIGWMGQLAQMPGEWQVHIDGKWTSFTIPSFSS